MCSTYITEDIDECIAELTKMNVKNEYTYLQENGQIKYGGPPPNWVGPPPSKGTEVFVSRLPRDASLSEICPVFATTGDIYSARLMMDFSGSNRGFCFIQYCTKEQAKTTISKLHNYEIRPGHKICVAKSIDNCRLFIGQVPKELRKEDIIEVLNSLTTGLKEVILYLSPTDKSMNRGFCFVEYTDHRSAAMARRTLISGGIPQWGREVRIDWAIPEEEVDESVMSQVTVVYVRNLMLRTTEISLKDVIFKIVSSSDVTRIRKVKDFAFIHFKNREAAEKVISYLNGFILDGASIIATWAKPSPCDDMQNPISPNEKKEKDRRKLDGKKKILGKSSSNDIQVDSELSVVNYQHGSAPIYLEPISSTAVSPAVHYSSVPENMSMMMSSFGYQSLTASQLNNTLTVVPFVCPPVNPLKENFYRSVVDTYLNAYIPAVALRYILLRLGWGEVYFNLNFEVVPPTSIGLFSAQIFIVKPDRTVQYPPIFHTPAFTPYEAKNMAAIMFIKTYILQDLNISKIYN